MRLPVAVRLAALLAVAVPVPVLASGASSSWQDTAAAAGHPTVAPGSATSPAATWIDSGWTPAHRQCEMDGPDAAAGRPWRCLRTNHPSGWTLQVRR